MSLPDLKAIRLTLRAHLKSEVAEFAALVSEEKLSWENRTFTPPEGATWAHESVYSADETWKTTGLIFGVGFTQYDVIVPRGRGTEEGEDLAKKLAEALEHGTSLLIQGSSQYMRIENVKRLPGRQWDESWYAFGVLGRWWTDALKT